MVFRENTYSLLLVSASEKLAQAVRRILPVNVYWPVETAVTAGEARRLLGERAFDLVLINSPLPDESGTVLGMDICDKTMSGVLLLVGSDLYDESCEKLMEHGVLTLPKPLTERSLMQALQMLTAMVERMKRIMEKQVSVEEKIDEIRLVNHAKWLLIEHEEITEPEAHRLIERRAMNERIPKRAVAEAVIRQYEKKENGA